MSRYNEDSGLRVPKFVAAVFAVLAIVVVCLLMDGCTVIKPGERGISVRLGSISEDFMTEGFYFKLPFVTKIHRVSVQQQTVATAASCFSSDLQGVTIQANVLYRIPENKVVVLHKDYKGEVFPALVEPRLQEAIKRETAKFSADSLVKSRDILKTETLAQLRLAVGDIVNIVDLTISNIDLSDQLERAIENKMVFEQESLAMKFKLEKATKEADIVIVGAKAEAESIKIKGEAISKNPDVILIEMVKKWNGVSPNTVVTGTGGANVVFPIERVK